VIDKSSIGYNPAMRTLAKVCLNSLWGRFSLRNQLARTIITDEPFILRQYLLDPKIDITVAEELSDDIFMILYTPKEEFVEEHDCSNVIISLWTTSAARVKLLKSLQKVTSTSNSTVLYMDTDSIIYSHRIDNDPLTTGPHLGDFTDESIDKEIVEFCLGGCKNYAIKCRPYSNPLEYQYILKIRGITLDYNACKALHYDSFKNKIINYGIDNDPITIDYNYLRPNLKKGTVFTVPISKKYRPYVSKGVVNNNYAVINYGM
jgi:hypothetical protein